MSNHFTSIISSIINQQDLSYWDMQSAMNQIMSGEINSIQISGFMVALQIKDQQLMR